MPDGIPMKDISRALSIAQYRLDRSSLPESSVERIELQEEIIRLGVALRERARFPWSTGAPGVA